MTRTFEQKEAMKSSETFFTGKNPKSPSLDNPLDSGVGQTGSGSQKAEMRVETRSLPLIPLSMTSLLGAHWDR